jgi:hypothetical protein
MKRCTIEHHVDEFGTIPAGSLWADDSHFIVQPDKFEDVPEADPGLAPLSRKFGSRKVDD